MDSGPDRHDYNIIGDNFHSIVYYEDKYMSIQKVLLDNTLLRLITDEKCFNIGLFGAKWQ